MIKILGGYQTDFARNWLKEGVSIVEAFKECVNLENDKCVKDCSNNCK